VRLAAFALVTALSMAAAEARAEVTSEELGLEVSPLWVSAGRAEIRSVNTPYTAAPDAVAAGLAASLPLFTQRGERWYWTPAALGFGFGRRGMLAQLVTEPGLRWSSGRQYLEVGTGVGVGILTLETGSSDCDASCMVGGAPFVFSPAIRYGFATHGYGRYGAVIRGVIPLRYGSDEPTVGGRNSGYAATVLFGLDVGFGDQL
jgi:hypothetical protein